MATVIEEWGRIDVLVNNGRYVGPGHMDHFVDTPIEVLDRHVQANVMAPVILTKAGPPPDGGARRWRESSTWPSSSGAMDPPPPAGWRGGWGLGYGAMSKAALHRVAGILALGSRRTASAPAILS